MHSTRRVLVSAACIIFGVLTCFADEAGKGPGLVSGEPLKLGAAPRQGPLAADTIVNHPLGAANVFGQAFPDLFVIAGSRFHPEMVVFPWVSTSPDGIPVFGRGKTFTAPEFVKPGVPGTVFERDGAVDGLWLDGGDVVHLHFDRHAFGFQEVERLPLPPLPRHPNCIGWLPDAQGPGFQLLLSIPDGVNGGVPKDGWTSTRDPRYDPYDGAGVWRGGFPYATLYAAHAPALLQGPFEEVRPLAATPREVRVSYESLTAVTFGPGKEQGVVGGSLYGPLYFYSLMGAGTQPSAHRNLVGPDGILIRHPTISPGPVAFPGADGRWSNLIAGGEGALYYYRFLDRFSPSGQPVYARPAPALQQDAALYAGTLPVPNVVDWDGDGALDIVTGNSEGLVLFFKNHGTNAAPSFGPGQPLEVCGHAIHVQAGYGGSIQGPGEARWGYTCPAVADWNGDSLPDLLLSDATAENRVYLNVGTAAHPRLDAGRPLYLDGLELHGTWRNKPAVGPLAGRMAYITLDDDDQFHLYRQVDAFNLDDGGKLKLAGGEVIGANFLKSGGTGRLKLNLVDWDGDGRQDLLVGTPRHASIPDPEHGLPQSLGLPGSSVILLRNAGSDKAPVFAPPELLQFRGEFIYFGQHACGPAVAGFGPEGSPGLVVGVETGRILYFSRPDISFATPPSKP